VIKSHINNAAAHRGDRSKIRRIRFILRSDGHISLTSGLPALVRKPTIGKQDIPNRLLQRVSTRPDAEAVLFCTRMVEQPLTLRVVQRTVREAEVRWAGMQSCDSTDKTSRLNWP